MVDLVPPVTPAVPGSPRKRLMQFLARLIDASGAPSAELAGSAPPIETVLNHPEDRREFHDRALESDRLGRLRSAINVDSAGDTAIHGSADRLQLRTIAQLTLAVMVRNWGFNQDGFTDRGPVADPDPGEAWFPVYRLHVMIALGELADVEFMSEAWFSEYGRPDEGFNGLWWVYRLLFEDFGGFPKIEDDGLYVYLPGREIEQMGQLAALLEPLYEDLLVDDRHASQDPRWPAVTELAGKTLTTMVLNWGFPPFISELWVPDS